MARPAYQAPAGPLPRQDDDFYWNRLPLGPAYDNHSTLWERISLRNTQSGKFAYLTGGRASAIDVSGALRHDLAAVKAYRVNPRRTHNWSPNYPAPLGPAYIDQQAQQAVNDAKASMQSSGFPITVKKIIGAGGHGCVALCEYKPRAGETHECIVKCPKGKHMNPTLAIELLFHDQFRGAKHLVHSLDGNLELFWHHQKLLKQPLPPACIDNLAMIWYCRELGDPQPNMAMLEHCHLGNVDPWIGKACNNFMEFPDRLLWHIMHCLNQGLIGMAYPNVRETQPGDEEIPLDKDGNPEPPCHFVHFDIDELNVFVALDPAEPEGIPVFKIADYGLMRNYSPDFIDQNKSLYTEMSFWYQRDLGKPYNFTPEQFTMEWDALGIPTNEPLHKFLPGDPRKPPVAGNYGIHTNVFQVGLMMYKFMTQLKWDKPYSKGIVHANGRRYETYGYRLDDEVEYGHIDRELRDLVMGCLEHLPTSRPTLLQLQTQIQARRAKGFGTMDDAAFAKWCQDFFLTPHLPKWRDILKTLPPLAPATGKRQRGPNNAGGPPPKRQRPGPTANPRAGRNAFQIRAATQLSLGLARDNYERTLGHAQRANHLQGQVKDQFDRLQAEQDQLLQEGRAHDAEQVKLHDQEKLLHADLLKAQVAENDAANKVFGETQRQVTKKMIWQADDALKQPTADIQRQRTVEENAHQLRLRVLEAARKAEEAKMNKLHADIQAKIKLAEKWQLDARVARAKALELRRQQIQLANNPAQFALPSVFPGTLAWRNKATVIAGYQAQQPVRQPQQGNQPQQPGQPQQGNQPQRQGRWWKPLQGQQPFRQPQQGNQPRQPGQQGKPQPQGQQGKPFQAQKPQQPRPQQPVQGQPQRPVQAQPQQLPPHLRGPQQPNQAQAQQQQLPPHLRGPQQPVQAQPQQLPPHLRGPQQPVQAQAQNLPPHLQQKWTHKPAAPQPQPQPQPQQQQQQQQRQQRRPGQPRRVQVNINRMFQGNPAARP